jgi:hypothetical protein
MVLEGGYALPSGFSEVASDILLEADNFGGVMVRPAPYNFLTRLAPSLARPVGVVALRAGLPKAPRDLADLARRMKTRRALNIRALKAI